MKRILLFVGLMFAVVAVTVAQNKLNDTQLKIRTNIERFLQEEGFMPEIDGDGDIAFKREGQKHYVIIDTRDTSPCYITLSRYISYNDAGDKDLIAQNLAKLNLKKAVKALLYDNNYVIQAEMFLVDAESFRYIFYKLLKQLDALKEDINEICSQGGSSISNSNSISSGSQSFAGTTLINDDFSSYSSLWNKSKGKLTFKNGKMIFEDQENSGYSKLTYNLPYSLNNRDFQLTFSLKTTFDKTHSSLFFTVGNDWNDCYRLGLCTWDRSKIVVSYGTSSNSTKYYNYSSTSNLNVVYSHQYTMIKRGNNVDWYVNGNYIFSATLDEHSIDMNKVGFLVPNKHEIEVDNFVLKLL